MPGVADARIEPSTNGGAGMLHLVLEEGSDDVEVTERVTELLRSGFGLGVDTDHIQLVEDPEGGEAGAAGTPPGPVTAPPARPAPHSALPAPPAPHSAPPQPPVPADVAPTQALSLAHVAPDQSLPSDAAPTPLPRFDAPPIPPNETALSPAPTPPPISDGAPTPPPTSAAPTSAAPTSAAPTSAAPTLPTETAPSPAPRMAPGPQPAPEAVPGPQLVPRTRSAGRHSAVGSRLVIERLRFRSTNLEVHSAVTLGLAGRSAVGEASGAATSGGILRAVAAATLRAVEQLADAPVRVDVEHLERIATGPESTVVVWLTMLTASGSTRLTGAAAVRDDVRQAVVRATLDAVNRRLGPLLPEA